jgi:hypothetical protein
MSDASNPCSHQTGKALIARCSCFPEPEGRIARVLTVSVRLFPRCAILNRM